MHIKYDYPFVCRITGHPYSFDLQGLYAYEALSKPFFFRLLVPGFSTLQKCKQYLGVQASFSVGSRRWYGHITQIRPDSCIKDGMRYVLTIQPRTALISQKTISRIFKNMSILEVISNVLDREEFLRYRLQCQRRYSRETYIIQYRESNFQFITRLLTKANIFYYFSHENEQHIMMLIDDLKRLPMVSDPTIDTEVINLQSKQSIETFDSIVGKSSSAQVNLGIFIANRKCYLINRLTHTVVFNTLWKNSTQKVYRNQFHCRCLNSYQHLSKPILTIGGYQCAKVVSRNKANRIGIIFPWDIYKTMVLTELVHVQAGHQYGHQWLPSLNEQVIVMFDNDDLHRPFIIGSVVPNEPYKHKFYMAHKGTFDKNKNCSECYNKINFANVEETANIMFQATKDLQWQCTDVTQHINEDYFLLVNVGDITISVKCNDSMIKANKRLTLRVGKSAIELTPQYIKIVSPRIIIQNSSEGTAVAAARMHDRHSCPRVTAQIPHQGGCISSGSPSILINGKPAARVGDLASCAILINKVIAGAPNILFEGYQAARVKDKMQHGGEISNGSDNVLLRSSHSSTNLLDKANKKVKQDKYYYKIQWKE